MMKWIADELWNALVEFKDRHERMTVCSWSEVQAELPAFNASVEALASAVENEYERQRS